MSAYLTTKEAARYLRMSERKLRDSVCPRVRDGRLVRWRQVDLDAYYASRVTPTVDAAPAITLPRRRGRPRKVA